MFSLFGDQFIDDAVTRAEQSRISYNIQTEEFRTLNTNLQIYLCDIKTIDEDNRQIQETIEQIRTDYILSLENHLKRLPDDFRQQSQTLTEAHVERYKSKTRAKRFTNEREELKRRISFVASKEKQQMKHLHALQKQERTVRNEFNKINEQIQNLLNYVETEKQNYQQAMDKVDYLQIQLEQTCVERSKTEFEIQTLKEEVKLMQTAREFLDDERETILATQTEANEYLLSRLNESIDRIRDDFDALNKTQLKQMENEYQQMLKIIEENFVAHETIDETTATNQRTIQADRERLYDEQQSVLQELTLLNDHNQSLSERVYAMEADLYSFRNERMEQITTKDNEFDRSKLELQTLNEKLNHLAEYDRNLKFELTLYRGVLESEHRRKQQQKQSSISTSHVMRPTTLRSNNNTITDRTAWVTSSTQQSKSNDQQQEEILTTRHRFQSDYDSLSEDVNAQINDIATTETTSGHKELGSGDSAWQQLIDPFGQDPQQYVISSTDISQDADKQTTSPSSTVSKEDQSISMFEAQQSSPKTSSTSATIEKSPTSSTPQILRGYQSETPPLRRSPTTPPEIRSFPTTLSSIQALSSADTAPVSNDSRRSSSIMPHGDQTVSETEQALSSTSAIGSPAPSDSQRRPSTTNTSLVSEQQPPSRTSSISSAVPSDVQRRSSILSNPTVLEHQPSSRTSSAGLPESSDDQRFPTSAATSALLEQPQQRSPNSDAHQTSPVLQREQQLSSHVSLMDTAASLDMPRRHSIPYASAVSEHQPSSRTSSIGSATSSDIQRQPASSMTSTILEQQPSISDVHQLPSTSPQVQQSSSSRSSSVSSVLTSDVQRRPSGVNILTIAEQRPPTSDVHQMPSTQPQERQSSSRNSSSSSGVPFDNQPRFSAVNTPSAPERQPSSRTSSVSSTASFDMQRRASTADASAVSEPHPSTPSQERRSSSRTSSIPNTSIVPEHQPSSRTPSVNSAIPSSTQRLDASAASSTALEDQPSSSDVRQWSSTLPVDRATSSEVQSSTFTDVPTASVDAEREPSLITLADEIDSKSELIKSFGETSGKTEDDGAIIHVTDERTTNEVNLAGHHPYIYSVDQSSTEEYEVSLNTEREGSRSSSIDLIRLPHEERKHSLSQPDTNLSSIQGTESPLKQNEELDQTNREEKIRSSPTNETEENNRIDYNSSTVSTDRQQDDNLLESNLFSVQDTSKQSSHNSSLTDVEEVAISTSEKSEIRLDESDDPNLRTIIQDLRYAFDELANDDDLVEINNALPEKLLDCLEFRDQVLRTLFESLLRKYLVQAAVHEKRAQTLDWDEFRDIIFPMIAGRCTERHIRKLFDLFDTTKDGYLSLQEIADLLEVFQASDTIDLAQNIIDEYDTDHDGKLSVDELIEAIKKTNDINDHVLADETESQQLFHPSPAENQPTKLKVPIISLPPKTESEFSIGIPLLGRIFQKVGANSEGKQLDSHSENLSIKLTNEFIDNTVNISSDDLQLFIQLFLHKKQNTDAFIDWTEFRDVFLPIINNGFYTRNDIQRWFDILDSNQHGIITREQVIHLLRLLQLQNSEEIISKLYEITETYADNTAPWTLDELTVALDNVDETSAHLLTDNEQIDQIASFDNAWLSENMF